jgi:hypothetical protein
MKNGGVGWNPGRRNGSGSGLTLVAYHFSCLFAHSLFKVQENKTPPVPSVGFFVSDLRCRDGILTRPDRFDDVGTNGWQVGDAGWQFAVCGGVERIGCSLSETRSWQIYRLASWHGTRFSSDNKLDLGWREGEYDNHCTDRFTNGKDC